MPNDNAPDTGESVEDILNGGDEDNSNPAVTELLTGRANGAKGKADAQKYKVGGQEYGSIEEIDKRWRELRKSHDTHAQKSNILERLLKDPAIGRLAATDPEVRDSLRKAGFRLAEKEAEKSEDEGEERPDSATMIALRTEAKLELRDELDDLRERMGRKLTKDEAKEVFALIGQVPDLSVGQAWRLTSAYEKHMAASAEKKLAAERAKRGNRPSPNPHLIPGEAQRELPKSPVGLKDSEKGAYLDRLINPTK